MKTQIAEQDVTPELLKKVAPDVTSEKGQQKLMANAVMASKVKGMLDKALGLAADKLGGKSSSRIKSIETTMKKIGTKRLEHRDYHIDDINDTIGGRISVKKESDIPLAEKEIDQMEKVGLFRIKKKQDVNVGTYNARHIDVEFPNSTHGEIQLMTHQQEATSLVNHDLRAVHGENPPPLVKSLQEKQAKITDKMSNDTAKTFSHALAALHQATDGQPVSPKITAQMLTAYK